MKSKLVLIFLFCGNLACATDHYFSNSGNDGNPGTLASPWQTISKFNSAFATAVPGDGWLFNGGDTFYGQLNISRNGNALSPIRIGSYGTGRATITGFVDVVTWTNLGGNIWESTFPISTLSQANIVLINGVNTSMGRTPNSGYYMSSAVTGTTSISSPSLTGTPNWTGAEVVIRKIAWITDRCIVTSQAGNTLNYTSPSAYVGQVGWGFFIEDDARTLDQQNEWYYNPSSKKIRLFSTSMPGAVKVSSIDTLVKTTNRNFITISNINFTGSNKYSFQISSASIIIHDCDIRYNGIYGVWGGQNLSVSTGFQFYNNVIAESNNTGILLRENFVGAQVHDNTVINSGMLEGMMDRTSTSNQFGDGLQLRADKIVAEYNYILGSGYAGIEYFNNYDSIRWNYIDYPMHTLADGGGIYTWRGVNRATNTPNPNKIGCQVYSNIVLHAYGNSAGSPFVTTSPTGMTQGQGIYTDDLTDSGEVAYNTVAWCGFSCYFIHNNKWMNFHHNIGYNAGRVIEWNSFEPIYPISNMTFKNNIMVSSASTKFTSFAASRITDIGTWGSAASIDSNYYCRPTSEALTMATQINSGTVSNINLPIWHTTYGYDSHSHTSPNTVPDSNYIRLVINPTKVDSTVILGAVYKDMTGASYSNTILLHKFSGAILLYDTALLSPPPFVDAGASQNITLPTNSVTLNGRDSARNGGSIASRHWQQLSGPTATIVLPNFDTTGVIGMNAGTYVFQLTATDNVGNFSTDTTGIIVNDSTVIPPISDAGTDQTITTHTTTLDGSGSHDTDGTIVSYTWTQVSGPNTAGITSPSTVTTGITGLVTGLYVFRLTVVNNGGASAHDDVQVDVTIPPDPQGSKLIIIHGNLKFEKQ